MNMNIEDDGSALTVHYDGSYEYLEISGSPGGNLYEAYGNRHSYYTINSGGDGVVITLPPITSDQPPNSRRAIIGSWMTFINSPDSNGYVVLNDGATNFRVNVGQGVRIVATGKPYTVWMSDRDWSTRFDTRQNILLGDVIYDMSAIDNVTITHDNLGGSAVRYSHSVVVGRLAAADAVTEYVVAIGDNAANSGSTGNNTVAIGRSTAVNGDNAVAIGYGASAIADTTNITCGIAVKAMGGGDDMGTAHRSFAAGPTGYTTIPITADDKYAFTIPPGTVFAYLSTMVVNTDTDSGSLVVSVGDASDLQRFLVNTGVALAGGESQSLIGMSALTLMANNANGLYVTISSYSPVGVFRPRVTVMGMLYQI
jgi:hypothetical protein